MHLVMANPQKLTDLTDGTFVKSTAGKIHEMLVLSKQDTETDPKKTFRFNESSVLTKVKQFLPEMAEENAKLQAVLDSNPEKLNIENTDDYDGPIIEMDLALMATNDYSSSSIEDTDADSESSSTCPTDHLHEMNIKMPNKHKNTKAKCVIEELKDAS